MSDDLVKRLRELGDHASFEPHMYHTAADRIEELEAERDALAEAIDSEHSQHGNIWRFWRGIADKAVANRKTAEAERDALAEKLAKAVAMLNEADQDYNRKTNDLIARHADRIEELAKERDRYLRHLTAGAESLNTYKARIEELEAKLAQQDDLVQAAVAAALTEAAKIPDQWIGCEPITSGILALITPDAQAALDRVVAEARVDGAEIARQTVWDKLHGSQQAEQLCDAIDAAIREGSNERSEEGE